MGYAAPLGAFWSRHSQQRISYANQRRAARRS
jgi:hypothetical protein